MPGRRAVEPPGQGVMEARGGSGRFGEARGESGGVLGEPLLRPYSAPEPVVAA